MRILVTGGTGYIGSHTVVKLLESGYDVVILDNLSNSNIKVLSRIEKITGKSPIFEKADIRNKDEIRKVFSKYAIDAVIHFAGLKAVGESVENPLLYYSNNIGGTVNLCSVMDEFNCHRLVFSSSATVYGDFQDPPFSETDRVGQDLSNPYGKTKYMIEEILTDLQKSNNDWKIVLLRYFNPIGAHSSGLIGENPNGIPNNLMPFITQVAVGKREKLYIFGDDYDTPDGTCIRDYIHVEDLARGHVLALNKIKDESGLFIYNLGTGNGYSVLNIVHAFIEATGIDIPHEITDRRPGDIASSYSNPKKAEKEIGFKAEKSLKDMCRDSWNWQSKNPNGYED